MHYMRQGLGNATLDRVGSAVEAASKVIEDPYLPEVTCHLLRLNRISRGENPGAPCSRTVVTAAQRGKGVGMGIAAKGLRVFAWARTNPGLAIGVGVGAVGLVFGLGYLVGRNG